MITSFDVITEDITYFLGCYPDILSLFCVLHYTIIMLISVTRYMYHFLIYRRYIILFFVLLLYIITILMLHTRLSYFRYHMIHILDLVLALFLILFISIIYHYLMCMNDIFPYFLDVLRIYYHCF
jgi:hypothetical protein